MKTTDLMSSKPVYSPGPWGCQGFVCAIEDVGNPGDLMRVVDRNGHLVGYGRNGCCKASEATVRLPDQPYSVFSPNGLLISAAPDLYEFVRHFAEQGDDEFWTNAARALIAEIGLENTQVSKHE